MSSQYQMPRNPTLEQAKRWLRERFDEGADCPCCTQHVKRYKRPLNSSMAYVLALIYRASGRESPYFHVPTLIVELVMDVKLAAAARGDFAKLRYWGLLEEQTAESATGSPHAGNWRITDKGRQFVEGVIRVPAYVYVFKGEALKKGCDEMIDIKDALGTKFDYDAVVRGAA